MSRMPDLSRVERSRSRGANTFFPTPRPRLAATTPSPPQRCRHPCRHCQPGVARTPPPVPCRHPPPVERTPPLVSPRHPAKETQVKETHGRRNLLTKKTAARRRSDGCKQTARTTNY